jgi:uncharacterized membrane protein
MDDDTQPVMPWAAWRSIFMSRSFLPVLFLLLVLPLAVVCAFIVPPGQVADEPAHISKAASLLHGELIGHRATVDGAGGPVIVSGVDANIAPMQVAMILAVHPPHIDRALLATARAVGWADKTTLVGIGPIAGYFPGFYLPAALGMGVAHVLGASPFDAVLAGRVVNTLCFGLLGAAALLLARRGRTLIFCTLAVPMSPTLAASFNQDGLMIAATALAAALLTRRGDPALPPEPQWRSCYALAAVLVALICLAKPPYLPIALMLLLPLPPVRFLRQARPELLRRVGVLIVVAGLVVGWAGFAIIHVTSSIPYPPEMAGPLWPGDPAQTFDATDVGAQLRVLFADPLRLVTLPVTTLLHDVNMVFMMIGVLGWLDVMLPKWIYGAWQWAALAALLADAIGQSRTALPSWFRPPALTDTMLLLLGVFSAFLGIYLSQYLIWTHVGLARIDGPQGRYLLPLIPVVALAIPRFRLRGGEVLSGVLTAVPLAVAMADVFVLPMVLVATYRPV